MSGLSFRRIAVPLVAAALAGCGSVAPSPKPADTGPVAQTTPTTVSPPSDTWELVPMDPAQASGLLLADVISTDDGFVAVGPGPAGHGAVALASADGLTWTVEPITAPDRTPSRLVQWGDKVIAYGGGETSRCAHPFGLDTWVRASGSWTEAPFADELCDASLVDAAIVAGVPVMVGSGAGDNAIAWSSTDGLTWDDHSGQFAGLLPRGVESDGTRAFAAGQVNGQIWTSSTTDGVAWSPPSPLHDLPRTLEIVEVVSISGTATIIASDIGNAVGVIDPGTGAGWVTEPAVGLRADLLIGVRTFDAGLLAVGGDGTAAQAWVSRDGRSWRALDLPPALLTPDASVNGVAVRDGRAILIGTVARAKGEMVSSIWTGAEALVAP
jgi:hypothetical protein